MKREQGSLGKCSPEVFIQTKRLRSEFCAKKPEGKSFPVRIGQTRLVGASRASSNTNLNSLGANLSVASLLRDCYGGCGDFY